MEFSKQEYWSGLPFPSPGDLPDPGIEPRSPALAGRFFTTDYKMKIIHNTAEFDFKIFYGLKNQLVPTPNTLLI